MGTYVRQDWTAVIKDGGPRRLRRSGPYEAYVPDRVTELPPPDPVDVDYAAEAGFAALRASALVERVDLGSFATLLTRSEAIGSSFIEGYKASAKSVALADFTKHGSSAALLVARNAAAIRGAVESFASAERVTVEDLTALHAKLLPSLPGLRREPVFIGGATPFEATYIAPPHELVLPLLTDLLEYANDPADNAIVAAATVHAAFETIHPYRDGNGRIGRALIHTALARGGVTTGGTILPVSQVLARRRLDYYDALQEWQSAVGERDGRSSWLRLFSAATIEAAEFATETAEEVTEVRTRHRELLARHRSDAGRRALPGDSLALRILADEFDVPVSSSRSVSERLGVSDDAARDALELLAEAGVLSRKRVEKGKAVAYVFDDVLALANSLPSEPEVEGSLPVLLGPRRPAGARGRLDGPRCGYWMSVARRPCTERLGHGGQHR